MIDKFAIRVAVITVALIFTMMTAVAAIESITGREADPVPACGLYRVDVDGRVMVPQDLNGDGRITGDIEMGS